MIKWHLTQKCKVENIKSINIVSIHHTDITKGKKYIIISLDTEKAFEKV